MDQYSFRIVPIPKSQINLWERHQVDIQVEEPFFPGVPYRTKIRVIVSTRLTKKHIEHTLDQYKYGVDLLTDNQLTVDEVEAISQQIANKRMLLVQEHGTYIIFTPSALQKFLENPDVY